MTTTARLAFAATVLFASPALAQPGSVQATPPVVSSAAPPAPYTDAWQDVSHINGQVVPVGERGNYLLKQKKLNIASNPIGWMVGFYGLSASYALSNNIAVRADLNYFDLGDGHKTGYEYGISLPIYFKRTYHGPFIEPGIITRGLRRNAMGTCGNCATYDGDTDESMTGPEMLVGYHMTFDSGLNVAAAFGLARNLTPQTDEYGYTNTDPEPAGYFRVGYAF